MKRFRLLLLVGLIFLVVSFAIFHSSLLDLFASKSKQKSLNQELLKKLSELPLSPEIKNILATSSSLPKIDFSKISLDDLKKIAQDLPQKLAQQVPEQIAELAPKIQDLVNNSQREELFLRSPQSLTLNFSQTSATSTSLSQGNTCRLNVKTADEQITFQLGNFEVKDSRKSNTHWVLTISLGDLVGEGHRISQENFKLSLEKNQIQVLEGNVEELQITQGEKIRVWTRDGQGKGHFLLTPRVTAKIASGDYEGSYHAQIQTTFE